MYCRVVELWENGHLVPGHRLKNADRWREGDFSIEPCNHEVFQRTLRRAKLIRSIQQGGMGEEALPYLHDADVVILQHDFMRVSGFYYDEFAKRSLMQTWHVIFLATDYREWTILDAGRKAAESEMKRVAK